MQDLNSRWYDKLEAGEERWEKVSIALAQIRDDHEEITDRYLRWLHLYSNREYSGFGPGDTRQVLRLLMETRKRIKLNVIQSCVDTLAAKICAQKPRPQFLTSGGDWSEMRKARGLEKFVEGVFYQSKIYEQARMVFLDAAIFGTGYLKFYTKNGKVSVERVFPSEIVVDEGSALTSSPRTMHQVKLASAECLVARFAKDNKKLAMKIRAAVDREADSFVVDEDGRHIERGLLEVKESWHLPSGPGAGDGRHCITAEGVDIIDESWNRDSFPFLVFRWLKLPFGYLGQGLVEQLAGAQVEVDKLITRIQDAMHIHSVCKIYAEEGSIDKEQLRNITGDVVWIKPGGQMPTTQMPGSVSSELFTHLWQLVAKMYEIAGISQLSASSMKPAGVESGIALRTLLDTETQRFALLARDWEEMFCEAARMVVEEAKSGSGAVKTMWAAKDYAETIDFSKVDLDRDSYVLKVYPTNMLPQTPAGRLSTVQEMLTAGFIDPKEAMSLLDFPDLEQSQSLMRASRDLVDRDIEMILDGKEIEARPWQDLQMALQRTAMSLQKTEQDGAPKDVLARLSLYLSSIEDLLEDQEAEAQQQAMLEQAAAMQEGGPPGGPGLGEVPGMEMPPADQMAAPPA
jgi:hypothetical protein